MKKKLMAVLLALSMTLPMNHVTALAADSALSKTWEYQRSDAKPSELPERGTVESSSVESNSVESSSVESNTLESETIKIGESDTFVPDTAVSETTDDPDRNDKNQTSSSESEIPLTEITEKTEMKETEKIVCEITEKVTEHLTKPEKETSTGMVTSPKQQRTKVSKTEPASIGKVSKAKQTKQKEYAPKSNSARITSCKGSGVDRITIKANIGKRIKSADSYYYLVTVDPNSGKILKRAAKTAKKTSVTFTLKTAEPNRGYVLAKYAIAIKQKKGYKVISSAKYVTNPEITAVNRHTYETGQTKKGIQFTTTQDVENVDAKNTFLNLYASTILSNPDTTYKYNGKTYHFNSLRGYEIAVSEFNAKGINVTLQLGLDWGDGSYQDLIASQARSEGHILYTWNTSNKAAREKMEAMFSFLASKFSTSECHVSNWVLGNEVNSCNLWNYKGSMSKKKFINSYAYAFRSLYNAAKSNWNNSKVFICLDHCWNTADAGYTAKDFMNSFAKKIKSMQGGINWNVAFHAYPAPLTSPDFWNNSAVSSKEDSPYVTMENIQVLTNYVKKHYGSKTRIILSEQGFSSSKGEDVQAAAIAYGYYKAACNPMIDSFIIRSYSDEPCETAQGLYMGISGKKSYKVFKYMDTRKSGKYTNKYLKTIGKSSWKKAVPGYTPNRIYKMYRK
ncbi:DUF5722 domain-containing protein [Robinsoniella peoriensis]|uniref:DUF5722 domain-containing protein n=1 Tax=Robinsoniella peoriensis TaxID=180332 RepID=UPI003753A8DD